MKEKISLFLITFLIVFSGMTMANIFGCVIYGIPGGDVLARVVELPYALFVVLSLIISTILLCLIFRRNKK